MRQAPTAVPGRSVEAEFPRAFGILSLLKPLATDERAEIYVALRPEGIDRLCVVNLLSPKFVERKGVMDTIRAQSGWLVARVHGNLVQTYDVGHVADRLFLLNEYVEGRDLAAVLTAVDGKNASLSIDAAVYVALEVSTALGFIRGTEERVTGIPTSLIGLSPASVIVSHEGSIKVLHHGSGLMLTPETLAEKDLGLVSLIAPEHVRGGGSERGDVYAVGALLWHMLAGRPLAEASGPHLEALRRGDFWAPRVSKVEGGAREVPAALDDLVASALSKKPEDRPPTCEALREQLVSAVKGAASEGSGALKALIVERFEEALTKEAAELTRLSALADKQEDPVRAQSRPRAATLTNFDPVSRRVSNVSNDDLPLGKVIPGSRYRVLEKLGEGGMGAVYAAEHVDIERRVALKLVHAELLRNPVVLGQFRQEARAASRIGNPYICDVTDWGELPDGRVFFVMEYLDGISLGKLLIQKRKLLPLRCLPILRQVAKALGSAHEKGIVHLDVKPDNVLLLHRDGRGDAVKVVDFGVAGILGQASGALRVMGTPEYMAPERATGRSYDHRSDVYSLGVMAYEMLVGEVPFQGATPMETLAMQAADLPDRINERLTAPVPTALEAVIMKMLEKDPQYRPDSMAEVEALLLEAQIEARIRTPWDDLPLPAVAPERAARLGRRLRSSIWRLAMLAGAGSAVVLSLIVSIYFASRKPVVIREPALAARAIDSIRVVPFPSPPVRRLDPSPAAGKVEPTTPRAGRNRREESSDDVTEQRDPVTSRRATQRGLTALEAGSIEQAKAEFERAVAADPRNGLGVGGLAEVDFERAKYEEAAHYAGRATRLSPRTPKYFVILGDSSFKLARYADALNAYQRAKSLEPNYPGIDARIQSVNVRLGASRARR